VSESTVAAGYASALLEFAVSKGVSRTALAERSGLAHELTDPDGRIPLAKYVALMRAGKELSGDPALALHYAEATDLSEISIVGLIGPSSAPIAEAFAQLNRYVRVAIDVELGAPERFQLAAGEGGLWVVDTRVNPNEFFELTESTFARFVCNIRLLASDGHVFGGPPIVKMVHVTHDDPGYRAEYDRIFRAPVIFASDKNAILLNEAWLHLRTPERASYAFGVFSEHAEALLKSLDDSKTTRGRVERLLMLILHTRNVSMKAIADKLGCTRSTLLRRLKAEGATFEQVLDELRHRMALHYLTGKKISVNETAYLVGFSEPAAFSRAFKRWTGTSPRAARASRVKGRKRRSRKQPSPGSIP
jgi:AraC-like DNA-binding protein